MSVLFSIFQVWNQNGKNPSITYEYTLLKRPHLKNAQPIYYTFSESDSEESREFDGEEPLGFIQHNASYFGTHSKEKIHFENQVLERQDSTEDLYMSKIQETNEVYEQTEANACTPVLRKKQPKGEEMELRTSREYRFSHCSCEAQCRPTGFYQLTGILSRTFEQQFSF